MKISADFQICISVPLRNMKNIKPTKYVSSKYQRLLQIKKFFLILSTVVFCPILQGFESLLSLLIKWKLQARLYVDLQHGHLSQHQYHHPLLILWSSTSASVSSSSINLDDSLSSTVLKQITRSILKLHISHAKYQYHITSSTYHP